MSSENSAPLKEKEADKERVYALLVKREDEANIQAFHASMGLKMLENTTIKKSWKKLLETWQKEDEANGEVWCSEELSPEAKEYLDYAFKEIEWSSDIERELVYYLYRISMMYGLEEEEEVDIEVTPAKDTWEDMEHVRYVAYMLDWEYKNKQDFYRASILHLNGTESRILKQNVSIRDAERIKKALEEAGATVRLIPGIAKTEEKINTEE